MKSTINFLLISFIFFLTLFIFDTKSASAETIQFTETRDPGFYVWENAQSKNWSYETRRLTGELKVYQLSNSQYLDDPIGLIYIQHQKPTTFIHPVTKKTVQIKPEHNLRLVKVEPYAHTGFSSSQVMINQDYSPTEITLAVNQIRLHGTGVEMTKLNEQNKGKIVTDNRYSEQWHLRMELTWELDYNGDVCEKNPNDESCVDEEDPNIPDLSYCLKNPELCQPIHPVPPKELKVPVIGNGGVCPKPYIPSQIKKPFIYKIDLVTQRIEGKTVDKGQQTVTPVKVYRVDFSSERQVIKDGLNQDLITHQQMQADCEQIILQLESELVCDSFCAGLKFTKNNRKKVWNFLAPFLSSKHEFELRFGIVMLLNYYIEEEYINKVLVQLNSIQHEGYYVKMAIAWAISFCFVKYPEQTILLLKSNNLDDFTYNKALQKITELNRVDQDTKNMIRQMKRKNIHSI